MSVWKVDPRKRTPFASSEIPHINKGGGDSTESSLKSLVSSARLGSDTEDIRLKEELLDIEGSQLKGSFLVLPYVPNAEAGRQDIRSGSRILLHGTFNFKLYALARLSELGDHDRFLISEAIDERWRLDEVLSIIELPDESFELVVLSSSFRTLESQFLQIFPGYRLEQDDPTEPDEEDVNFSR